jgi:uncharacterized membrane protein YdjX (TVP38/TMEM64 family)
MGEMTRTTAREGRLLGRWLPVLVLATGFALFFLLDLQRFISFETLQEHREWLVGEVGRNKATVALTFILLYAVVIAFSIPGGAVMTISAGFLFGTVLAASCAVVGGTLGAICLFLAARTAFRDILRARAGPALKRMEAGFRENALSYLLFLRLIPLFPFWLVNLVPAFLGVPLRTYVLGTFVGIIPGTIVYASLGNGLGAVLDAGERPDLEFVFKPVVLIPILALAVLALLPVVYKKIKGRRAAPG